jgi:hypothetical protein
MAQHPTIGGSIFFLHILNEFLFSYEVEVGPQAYRESRDLPILILKTGRFK